MPFKFVYICDLLEKLDEYETQDPPLLPVEKNRRIKDHISAWFKNNAKLIHHSDCDHVAFLSCLLPERRTDRVYGIQTASLLRILARCLGMGSERVAYLRSWKPGSRQDLGAHVEKLQRCTDVGTHFGEQTIEDVDLVLAKLAAKSRFSSPAVRARHPNIAAIQVGEIIQPLVRSLPSRDLKWFVRILLKRLGPINLDESHIYRSFHFMLPDVIKLHSTFDAAIAILQSPDFIDLPPHPDAASEKAIRSLISHKIKPRVGDKIGRPAFLKARSLKHCLQTAASGLWSIEPKYDGEYAQIHVDLSKGENCIQIFSKSGKDSTRDRIKLHRAIAMSLRLGQPDCPLKRSCILEGEMVVYSDTEKKILDFHKIRKHVSRSGSFLGTEQDSPAHEHERLMIIYYDLFAIDDENVMARPYAERRARMKQILQKYEGWAITSQWACLEVANNGSRAKLTRLMSHAIANRAEGLVLKPCAGPFFSMSPPVSGRFQNCFIKLKKDYIPGLGDTADFAIIGANYEAAKAQQIGLPKISWTTFFIACLQNKDEVTRYEACPTYRVMGSIGPASHCLSKDYTTILCNHGRVVAEEFRRDVEPTKFRLYDDGAIWNMEVVFREPVVVEVLGSSFDKPASCSYYMLRHPRVLKIHTDRSIADVIGFDELQDIAKNAVNIPADVADEELHWFNKLHNTTRVQSEEMPEEHRVSPYATRDSEPSRTSKSPRVLQPVPMVRMDSRDMRPGDPRYVQLEQQTSAGRYSISMTSAETPQTPPPSSVESSGDVLEQDAGPLHEIALNKGKRKHNGDPAEISSSKRLIDPVRGSFANHSSPLTPAGTPHKPKSIAPTHRQPSSNIGPPESGQVKSEQVLKKSRTLVSPTHDSNFKSPFADSILYIPPELSGFYWLNESLLKHWAASALNIYAMKDLQAWDREIDEDLGPHAAMVQESQAHVGNKKIVLIDRKLPSEARATILEVRQLRFGKDEVVDFWDWRDFEQGVEKAAQSLLHNLQPQHNIGKNVADREGIVPSVEDSEAEEEQEDSRCSMICSLRYSEVTKTHEMEHMSLHDQKWFGFIDWNDEERDQMYWIKAFGIGKVSIPDIDGEFERRGFERERKRPKFGHISHEIIR